MSILTLAPLITIFLPLYLLQSIGLSTFSKRRNLPHGWLSWVPLFSLIQLGTIADDINNADGRKAYHGLRITVTICALVIMFFPLVDVTNSVLAPIFFVLNLFIIAAFAIVIYHALYQVFRVYGTPYPGAYLAISIFLPFMRHIYLFLFRNRQVTLEYHL